MTKVVNGFIQSKGKRLVNDGGELLLRGWGIGNWLLAEGYMWHYGGAARMDRQRRIEGVIQELIGSEEAIEFWRLFRRDYFTKLDLERIKSSGYNSIRLPLDWRLFMEEEPELVWKAEGFEILERVVVWCREVDLYVFFDMHGAPGGQTGANIDDCIDDMPRLFMDTANFEKGLALWEEIARRYSGEPVVAGYDLLNEPIRPGDRASGRSDCDYLVPELSRFYREAIARIRAVDIHHLIALEGHHWATDTAVFNQNYDDNWCIHFHRYWDDPEEVIFEKFLQLQEQYNVPLWLGETGENEPEWFAAISQICEKYQISYHFWTYKRMGERVSAEIKEPADWAKITAYAAQGPAPSTAEARKILWELLENIRLENCLLHEAYDASILRNRPYRLKATSFDTAVALPKPANFLPYRREAGLELVENAEQIEKMPFHSHHLRSWWTYDLRLQAGESVTYLPAAFEGAVMKAKLAQSDGTYEIVGTTLTCLSGQIQIESVTFE